MPLPVHLLMTTPQLLELRVAFTLDRAAGADPAFCDGRLASIDQVLRERGVALPEDEETT